VTRAPDNRRVRGRGCLDPLIAGGLSVAERAQLAAEGDALSDEEAVKMALGSHRDAPIEG